MFVPDNQKLESKLVSHLRSCCLTSSSPPLFSWKLRFDYCDYRVVVTFVVALSEDGTRKRSNETGRGREREIQLKRQLICLSV